VSIDTHLPHFIIYLRIKTLSIRAIQRHQNEPKAVLISLRAGRRRSIMGTAMGAAMGVLAVIAVILFLIVVFVIGVYNSLVGLRNQVDNAWSQIDVQLKRRHDRFQTWSKPRRAI
jgi:hypothetical protein